MAETARALKYHLASPGLEILKPFEVRNPFRSGQDEENVQKELTLETNHLICLIP